MKCSTATTVAVALSVALAGCGSDNKTSTFATTPTTGAAPGAPSRGIADYVSENHITETPQHKGDPGSPVLNLPTPPGWRPFNTDTSYGAFVLARPADPTDPPTITVLFSKLTGGADPAKIIEYAPAEVQGLPGYQGSGKGTESPLGGFQAWQLSGTYQKDGKTRAVAQKTVVIPSQDGVFVLQIDADALDSDRGPLMGATSVIDDQTTIAK
jgi:hypothetical protein